MTTLRTLLAVAETKSTQGESKDHPDLRLGVRLINEIRKKGIISSHDIVAVEDQPINGQWDMAQTLKYCQANGINLLDPNIHEIAPGFQQIIQKFADHAHLRTTINDVSLTIMNEFGIKGKEQCRQETWQLCAPRFGMAECGDLSMLLAMDLVKAGCKHKINRIAISNNGRVDGNFAHQFIVIGDCAALKDMKAESLGNFAKLSDDCILLDPKLYITGKAKDAQALLAKYIKTFGYNKIINVETIEPADLLKKIPTIESNVELVCSTIEDRTSIKMLPKSHLDDPEYLKKVVGTLLGCCKMLQDSPELQQTVMQQMAASKR